MKEGENEENEKENEKMKKLKKKSISFFLPLPCTPADIEDGTNRVLIFVRRDEV